ncbi:MAG: hypothetical protein K0Q65_108, partial [Clostridia bacterium]|nr:hypothetical protein [Clostridia bacterium]
MRHISIKSRLIAVLVVFIVAFIGFGLFAIVKVGELEHVTNSIYDDPLKVSSAVMEARVDIAKLQEQVRDMLIAENADYFKAALLEVSFLERRIYDSLDHIRAYVASEDSLELEKSVRESFIKWRKNQDQILKEFLQGNKQIAIEVSKGTNIILAESIEQDLIRIDNNAKYRASQLVKQANEIQIDLERLLIIINIGLSIFFIILFSLVIRSIVRSIGMLQHTMNESAVTGVLRDAVLEGNNEIAGIAKYYNVL